ncbi:MAG: ATP-dependent DNA helicase RecG [Bdellovibrionota bacterium]|nr:ATP-dependent DNA helicase RecG [Bdellovibrionota bacterium]
MSTSNLDLSDSIAKLYKKPTKSAQTLMDSGIETIEDLLWVIPRKILKLPDLNDFGHLEVGEYFRGAGSVVSVRSRPNFRARGKGRALLYNVTVTVKDIQSEGLLNLTWFNCYSSIEKKIKALGKIEFIGIVSEYNDSYQIANPEFGEYGTVDRGDGLKIQYPTIATVSSTNVKKVIDKIPLDFWDTIEEVLPETIIEENDFIDRSLAFQYLHGIVSSEEWDQETFSQAKDRLIYEEFFLDQIKVSLRKQKRKESKAISFEVSKEVYKESLELYPYTLTEDQSSTLNDIIDDFRSTHPMMRLIQGDVGCGKTTVAVQACYYVMKAGYQCAFMCPTESLATQHFNEVKEILGSRFNIEILLGSTSNKEKKTINEKLKNGEIDLIIGTHSLFQDSVEFKNLGFSIIDEQHKFGVEQRLKLVAKGKGSHCLIMSATPIPRSLSLTQYGDLDISIIKTMPGGRRGSQTRIVEPDKFEKFLSFMKTRISLGEQAYLLVPAINESPDQNIRDLEQTYEKFTSIFPDLRIKRLHGQMKAEEKALVFKEFKEHDIDLLIATSVIEVGINVTNATIMAILNPERFGLSSLHQMRGRVGRGSKPGFCFLILEKKLQPETMHRLQVIEKYSDGFKISEEDLKIRGQGDLFGQEQSGVKTQKKIANIIEHQDIFYRVIQDFKVFNAESNTKVLNMSEKLKGDQKIYTTI